MAKETVLLYNCGGDEFKTLRAPLAPYFKPILLDLEER